MVLNTLLICKFFATDNKKCLIILFSLGGFISFLIIACFIISFFLIYKRNRTYRKERVDKLKNKYEDFISEKTIHIPEEEYSGVFENYYYTLDNNTKSFFSTLDYENQALFIKSFIKKDKSFN